MENKENFKSLVTNVLLRIICFLVFYVSLIGLGIAIFWGVYQVVCWVIDPEILFYNIKSTVVIIVSVAGLASLAIMFAAYLIKPLFSSTKNQNDNRREVKRSECPELFAMIDELVEQVKCKSPKHVYLSPDVNACVFYDTSFWSIFFPVRKNLEIGLGLFLSTNVSELKSIIAHEFGHFSQRSMKVGSTVYVTNQIIYNLIYTKDSFEELLDKWCLADYSLWRFFGVITRGLTNQVKKLNVAMYRFVQKGYLRLSRQMEYDADNIACSCVGKDAFISALCKIEAISERKHLYERFLLNYLTTEKKIENYWEGYDAIIGNLEMEDTVYLTYDKLLISPAIKSMIPSRLQIENVWSSHPSLEERIKNASLQQQDRINVNTESSWCLIASALKEEIGDQQLKLLEQQIEGEYTITDTETFRKWVTEEMEKYFIPNQLKPYLNRAILFFDKPEHESIIANPFTEENRKLLAEYETACQDWNILLDVASGRANDIKELRYCGKVYNKKQLPTNEHTQYLVQLQRKVIDIDKDIYVYLKQNAIHPNLVEAAYHQIFYVSSVQESLYQMIEIKNNLVNELNRVVKRDEDELKKLILQVQHCEAALRTLIGKVNMQMLSVVVSEEYINALIDYAKREHNINSQGIDIEIVKEMVNIIDALNDMHKTLNSVSYRMIVGETKEIITGINQ